MEAIYVFELVGVDPFEHAVVSGPWMSMEQCVVCHFIFNGTLIHTDNAVIKCQQDLPVADDEEFVGEVDGLIIRHQRFVLREKVS